MSGIYTITASATGRITSASATYANARSGSSQTASTAVLNVGQATGFTCLEGFLYFDTTVVPAAETVISAVLRLGLSTDATTTDVVFQARATTWSPGGLTAADWVAGASLSSLTLLATLASSTFGGTGVYYNCVDVAMIAAINKSGNTEMLLCSDAQVAGTQPSASENANFALFNDGSIPPKLVVATADQVDAPETDRVTTSPMRW